jgi:hypothetical protein
MAGRRLQFYPELREWAEEIIGPFWKIGRSDQQDISTLSDMVKDIDNQKSLDELVIFVHGYPGGMMLDDEDGNLKGYDRGEEALTKAFAKTKTQIGHIRFEGCWVGEDPNDMATFGGLFKAQDVSGFTWVHWQNNATVTIPMGSTINSLNAVLDAQGLAKWLVPTTPPMAQLASMAQSGNAEKKVWLEWFQATLDKKEPYLDQDGNLAAVSRKRSNFQQLGSHNYKVRSDATLRTVLAKDAKPGSGGQPPFEYVTVKLR